MTQSRATLSDKSWLRFRFLCQTFSASLWMFSCLSSLTINCSRQTAFPFPSLLLRFFSCIKGVFPSRYCQVLAHRVWSDCLALSLFFWRSLSYNINYLETTALVIWSCTNQSTLNWLYFFRFCRATLGASFDKHHLSEARCFLFSRYAEIILNAALLYSSTSIDSSITQAFSFVWRHTGEKEVFKKKCVWLYICGHKMKEGTAERFNQLRLSRVTRLPHFLPDVGWDARFYRLLTKKKEK